MTTAELLALAAFDAGLHAQAFPSFGSERSGAPVTSFCRIDEKPIRLHEPILEPDALIVQDPTLLHQVDLFAGLRPRGVVLLNSSRSAAELGLADLETREEPPRLLTVPASEIGRRRLGKPMPGAALLGAFAALDASVTLAGVELAILDKFGGDVGDGNVAAARDGFEHVGEEVAAGSGA